jgi:transcription elongation GreA/GreB family factor
MSKRRTWRNHALGLSQKAFERLMADEQRAQWVAQALGRVQRGKRALDRGQEELMQAFQLAVKSEYRAVGKQLSLLKRRTRELEERLDRLLASER